MNQFFPPGCRPQTRVSRIDSMKLSLACANFDRAILKNLLNEPIFIHDIVVRFSFGRREHGLRSRARRYTRFLLAIHHAITRLQPCHNTPIHL